jgi:hypothetical protein
MTSTAIQLSQFRAIEQGQQSLEFAAIVGRGVELEGKWASIKSISECIQSNNASSRSFSRSAPHPGPEKLLTPKQPSPTTTTVILVHPN